MMTLDEAILHEEDVANRQEILAENMKKRYGAHVVGYGIHMTCAEEHRQIANWLKELKAMKEAHPCEECENTDCDRCRDIKEWTRKSGEVE